MLVLLQGAAARCVAARGLELGCWCRCSGAAYSCLLLSETLGSMLASFLSKVKATASLQLSGEEGQ